MNMYHFTNLELADIHFIYGLADGNGRAAVRLYKERYSTRRQPNHQMFAGMHQNLVERGFFRATIEGTGRRRIARTPIFEEGVLHAVDQTSGTSVRALLLLQPEDLQQLSIVYCRVQPCILFMYRECSHYSQMIPHDVSRLHSGFLTKLRQTCTLSVPCCSVMKQPFHVKAGIVGDSLLGPYILPPRLDSHKYLVFRQEVLQELLTDDPAPIRRRIWFQQDGAPFHYARHVREHLDRTFPNRWIGRGGSTS
ncbi:DUF4817 domain-containing protein [Trichonephila clavipes]|nr:DUF4817 domain-containing protein [Trichonephila clavipes]